MATMPETTCVPFWDHEFHVPDYNLFADLAAGPTNASDLYTATGGRPQRSARWRAFRDLVGYDHELRAAFTLDGAAWGCGQLSRIEGERPFAPEEVAFLDRAAPVIARGLRASLTSHAATRPPEGGPGMAVLDATSRAISATDAAAHWFEELPSHSRVPGAVPIPVEVATLASIARSREATGDKAPRLRMRTACGIWVLVHASVLHGTDGHVAVIVEPAKASEVAPLIIEAYGLTQRELEVTRRISRGLKTAEIAAELHLSPHTIRDHVKAIFEKVGVSSRGELVATMFADHYHDAVDQAIKGA
jgi:DNA-binding CsgD family transcriptional regulator